MSAETAVAERPLFHVAPGQQTMYARSGWLQYDNPRGTIVMFRVGRFNKAHHATFDAGHFEMLRRGEWVLFGPRRYDDLGTTDGLGANNSLLLGNQPLAFERREMLGAGEVNGSYYLVMECGGPWRHGQGALEYVHSAKRWLVWLPGETDVLLVRDLIDISQPVDQTASRKAYNFGRARDRHAAYIVSQGTADQIPLVQAVFHAPVEPALFSWQTPGGQTVRLNTLAPGAVKWQTVDEANHYGANVAAKERGWQIRVSPAGFEGGQVELVNAVVIADAGAIQPVVTLEGGGVRVGARLVSWTEAGVEVQ